MEKYIQERSSYKIVDSHRQQPYKAVLKRDRDGYGWTWKGDIAFTDGHNFSFASKRTFSTRFEAEEYMRSFARDRIDNRLDSLR